jgi:quercetin dioxygenase-like cupin family protein
MTLTTTTHVSVGNAESTMSTTGELFHRSAGTGKSYWGPGDRYTFLVTGEESNGAVFAMEALVPAGGGPPMHIHRNEHETFYVLEGECTFHLEGETIMASPGDVVNIPIGAKHFFRNDGPEPTRLIVSFIPAGIEHFFEETLEQVKDPTEAPPNNVEEVGARYLAAAPRYGIEFLADKP